MDIVRVSDSLDPDEVLAGYAKGIFPMAYADAPVFSWHLPERRGVLPLDKFHISRSLARRLNKADFEIAFDRDFAGVVKECATRGGQRAGHDSWITPRLAEVYQELHRRGQAHSVEVWREGRLVGGTYGIHLGAAFFAESKFHRETDMSKVALWALVERLRQSGFLLLDVQYWTPHLDQFGVEEIDRNTYYWRLRRALSKAVPF
ncbi:MAG: leucyl/phenylalanyl-tRNA--protein transferase [Bryobacter sp.]|nr:leucyl/phenylalanyl-tRNA--protein transferase [Bryobacter sp.]